MLHPVPSTRSQFLSSGSIMSGWQVQLTATTVGKHLRARNTVSNLVNSVHVSKADRGGMSADGWQTNAVKRSTLLARKRRIGSDTFCHGQIFSPQPCHRVVGYRLNSEGVGFLKMILDFHWQTLVIIILRIWLSGMECNLTWKGAKETILCIFESYSAKKICNFLISIIFKWRCTVSRF